MFYAHLRAGGKLRLHRTPSPLLSYRHRSGVSQSSSTPRRLLVQLRAKAWEDLVYFGKSSHESNVKETKATTCSNDVRWTDGFAIWGAGRDGKDFLKALSSEVQRKVLCFVDVDERKIDVVKWYDNQALGLGRIPILHFSVLSKGDIGDKGTFGRIKKKHGAGDFDVASTKGTGKQSVETYTAREANAVSEARKNGRRKKVTQDPLGPDILRRLPVAVCVAMYRTNGALESNVASIGRTEGKDLWHII